MHSLNGYKRCHNTTPVSQPLSILLLTPLALISPPPSRFALHISFTIWFSHRRLACHNVHRKKSLNELPSLCGSSFERCSNYGTQDLPLKWSSALWAHASEGILPKQSFFLVWLWMRTMCNKPWWNISIKSQVAPVALNCLCQLSWRAGVMLVDRFAIDYQALLCQLHSFMGKGTGWVKMLPEMYQKICAYQWRFLSCLAQVIICTLIMPTSSIKQFCTPVQSFPRCKFPTSARHWHKLHGCNIRNFVLDTKIIQLLRFA